MLKFRWVSTVGDEPTAAASIATNSDLQVRNLLDDPRLRRAMELDTVDPAANADAPGERPTPVFNRRRLLERRAA